MPPAGSGAGGQPGAARELCKPPCCLISPHIGSCSFPRRTPAPHRVTATAAPVPGAACSKCTVSCCVDPAGAQVTSPQRTPQGARPRPGAAGVPMVSTPAGFVWGRCSSSEGRVPWQGAGWCLPARVDSAGHQLLRVPSCPLPLLLENLVETTWETSHCSRRSSALLPQKLSNSVQQKHFTIPCQSCLAQGDVNTSLLVQPREGGNVWCSRLGSGQGSCRTCQLQPCGRDGDAGSAMGGCWHRRSFTRFLAVGSTAGP